MSAEQLGTTIENVVQVSARARGGGSVSAVGAVASVIPPACSVPMAEATTTTIVAVEPMTATVEGVSSTEVPATSEPLDPVPTEPDSPFGPDSDPAPGSAPTSTPAEESVPDTIVGGFRTRPSPARTAGPPSSPCALSTTTSTSTTVVVEPATDTAPAPGGGVLPATGSRSNGDLLAATLTLSLGLVLVGLATVRRGHPR